MTTPSTPPPSLFHHRDKSYPHPHHHPHPHPHSSPKQHYHQPSPRVTSHHLHHHHGPQPSLFSFPSYLSPDHQPTVNTTLSHIPTITSMQSISSSSSSSSSVLASGASPSSSLHASPSAAVLSSSSLSLSAYVDPTCEWEYYPLFSYPLSGRSSFSHPRYKLLDWKSKERSRTVSVALVACLNIGVDPPDVQPRIGISQAKQQQSSNTHTHIHNHHRSHNNHRSLSPSPPHLCWYDVTSSPSSLSTSTVMARLQQQYERWQPKARYKQLPDPTALDIKKTLITLRKQSKHDRVLFHYNGFGVPRPTAAGEIWCFNKGFTQYIPIHIHEVLQWSGGPCVIVLDCGAAGWIIQAIQQWIKSNENSMQTQTTAAPTTATASTASQQQTVNSPVTSLNILSSMSSAPSPLSASSSLSVTSTDVIVLAACSSHQTLPVHSDLPADLFTSCLTTPLTVALRFFSCHSPLLSFTPQELDLIPGTASDRKTPLGELNWIFTSITDSIAFSVLDRDTFARLFRQDLLVASLFRNYLLADRVMRHYDTTPTSFPALPSTAKHPLWDSWDWILENYLLQLDKYIKQGIKFVHTTFFSEQLQAFEHLLDVTLAEQQQKGASTGHGSVSTSMVAPVQLPVVLQVLLSPSHRRRALVLLAKFLSKGSSYIQQALDVGIFPYMLKLLESTSTELREVLTFIWSKIIAADRSVREELLEGGYKYFIDTLFILSNNTHTTHSTDRQRLTSLFVLSCIMHHFPSGQGAVYSYSSASPSAAQSTGSSLLSVLASLLDHDHPLLRRWSLLTIANLVDQHSAAQSAAIPTLADKVCLLCFDGAAEVRCAAVFTLSCLFNQQETMTDTQQTTPGAGPLATSDSFSSNQSSSCSLSSLSPSNPTPTPPLTPYSVDTDHTPHSLYFLSLFRSLSSLCYDASGIVREEFIIALRALIESQRDDFILVAREAEQQLREQREIGTSSSSQSLSSQQTSTLSTLNVRSQIEKDTQRSTRDDPSVLPPLTPTIGPSSAQATLCGPAPTASSSSSTLSTASTNTNSSRSPSPLLSPQQRRQQYQYQYQHSYQQQQQQPPNTSNHPNQLSQFKTTASSHSPHSSSASPSPMQPSSSFYAVAPQLSLPLSRAFSEPPQSVMVRTASSHSSPSHALCLSPTVTLTSADSNTSLTSLADIHPPSPMTRHSSITPNIAQSPQTNTAYSTMQSGSVAAGGDNSISSSSCVSLDSSLLTPPYRSVRLSADARDSVSPHQQRQLIWRCLRLLCADPLTSISNTAISVFKSISASSTSSIDREGTGKKDSPVLTSDSMSSSSSQHIQSHHHHQHHSQVSQSQQQQLLSGSESSPHGEHSPSQAQSTHLHGPTHPHTHTHTHTHTRMSSSSSSPSHHPQPSPSSTGDSSDTGDDVSAKQQRAHMSLNPLRRIASAASNMAAAVHSHHLHHHPHSHSLFSLSAAVNNNTDKAATEQQHLQGQSHSAQSSPTSSPLMPPNNNALNTQLSTLSLLNTPVASLCFDRAVDSFSSQQHLQLHSMIQAQHEQSLLSSNPHDTLTQLMKKEYNGRVLETSRRRDSVFPLTSDGRSVMFDSVSSFSSGLDSVSCLLFHPHQPLLVAADQRRTVASYDYERKEKRNMWSNDQRSSSRITSLAFINPHSMSLLATGTEQGIVRIWRDPHTKRPHLVNAWIGLRSRDTTKEQQTQQQQQQYSSQQRGRYQQQSGASLSSVSSSSVNMVMEWMQSAGWMVCAGSPDIISVWDVEREICVMDLPVDDHVSTTASTITSLSSCSSSSSSLLFSGGTDGTLRCFDLRVQTGCSSFIICKQQSPIIKVGCMKKQEDERYTGNEGVIVCASRDGDVLAADLRYIVNRESGMSALSLYSTSGNQTPSPQHAVLGVSSPVIHPQQQIQHSPGFHPIIPQQPSPVSTSSTSTSTSSLSISHTHTVAPSPAYHYQQTPSIQHHSPSPLTHLTAFTATAGSGSNSANPTITPLSSFAIHPSHAIYAATATTATQGRMIRVFTDTGSTLYLHNKHPQSGSHSRSGLSLSASLSSSSPSSRRGALANTSAAQAMQRAAMNADALLFHPTRLLLCSAHTNNSVSNNGSVEFSFFAPSSQSSAIAHTSTAKSTHSSLFSSSFLS